MSKALLWVLIAGGMLTGFAACAEKTAFDEPPATGSGGKAGSSGGSAGTAGASTTGGFGNATTTGGAAGTTSSGGSAGSTAGTGGVGGNMVSGVCTPGAMDDCKNVNTLKLGGTATCAVSGSGWDLSACTLCEPDATDTCANRDTTIPPKTEGDAVCSSAGDAWDISGCVYCVDDATKPCSEITAVAGTTPFGDAVCASGVYDTSSCTVCDPGVTMVDCTTLGGNFSGGMATCDGTGNDYDTAACEVCGDDTQDSEEQCDGSDVSATTCDALGWTGDSTAVTACDTGCVYDTSDCSACDQGVAAPDCMEGGTCTDDACTNNQCGRDFTCTFNCNYHKNCTGMSCAEGATCTFACNVNDHYDCVATCKDGSTCTVSATSYQSDTNWTCESGATCNFKCAQQGECIINCVDGSSCSVNASDYNSAPQGDAFCAAGDTCTYSFINSKDNAPLSVTCDGTCNFTVGSYQTKISNILCRTGSTCDIDCTDASNVCSYTCDSGATCTCTGTGCTEL